MEKLTPIQKLDIVLEYMDRDDIQGRHLPEDLYKYYNRVKVHEIEEHEFTKILEKLAADKYLTVDKYENFKDHFNYSYGINFDGELFIQQGGYKIKDKRNRVIITRTNLLNYAIALGTLVAGIYYSGKIFYFLENHFPCLKDFFQSK